jgi:hypothetical protein
VHRNQIAATDAPARCRRVEPHVQNVAGTLAGGGGGPLSSRPLRRERRRHARRGVGERDRLRQRGHRATPARRSSCPERRRAPG